MNNNYNLSIIEQKLQASNHFYSMYHAPLIVDINSQSCYRKQGHVSWPAEKSGKDNQSPPDALKAILGGGGHVSWPKIALEA